jgi:hypothetical protein
MAVHSVTAAVVVVRTNRRLQDMPAAVVAVSAVRVVRQVLV